MGVRDLFVDGAVPDAVPIFAVSRSTLDDGLRGALERWSSWIKAAEFTAQAGRVLLLPGSDGNVAGVLFGLGADEDPLATATLSATLAAGNYRLESAPPAHTPDRVALAWAMGAYAFRRYKGDQKQSERARLAWPEGADQANVLRVADGLFLARDLVNTPSNDMGPLELEKAAAEIANFYGASIKVIVGDDLIAKNYPMIYAVGRGSSRAPRLIDVSWGDSANPRVTLVGKGVCFDSGGLDLKPSSAMATMKKDMGGSAAVLGLAHMIMDAKLPVALRVLIPAVENSVSGDAYRPGDVIKSRKGLTVEVGNTDAEGRLVLADALAEADSGSPDLLLCMATLTGAARVATGFDLPPFFTNDDDLANDIMRHGAAETDPLWRLPLWRGYRGLIEGKVADLTNNPDSAYAGAITAALFLERFVDKAKSFAHFDIAAWNDRAKPGRPLGGEAQSIRALFAMLRARYS
ncbi:MAG: leucyl aminopeptidase family protein [Alphaproteobacteria bacterium]|nr:leucyl aminopeptidase family protein [Alphaproteobacteria bacterium]